MPLKRRDKETLVSVVLALVVALVVYWVVLRPEFKKTAQRTASPSGGVTWIVCGSGSGSAVAAEGGTGGNGGAVCVTNPPEFKWPAGKRLEISTDHVHWITIGPNPTKDEYMRIAADEDAHTTQTSPAK